MIPIIERRKSQGPSEMLHILILERLSFALTPLPAAPPDPAVRAKWRALSVSKRCDINLVRPFRKHGDPSFLVEYGNYE